MKKVVILLIAVIALFSFSCNKYCNCKHYVNGEVDKNFKSNFVKESKLSCADFGTPETEKDGNRYEVKCK